MKNKSMTEMKSIQDVGSSSSRETSWTRNSKSPWSRELFYVLCMCMFFKPFLGGGCPSRFRPDNVPQTPQIEGLLTERVVEGHRELLLQAAEEQAEFPRQAENETRFIGLNGEEIELSPGVDRKNLLRGLLATSYEGEGIPCVPGKAAADGSIPKYFLKLAMLPEQKASIEAGNPPPHVTVVIEHLDTLEQEILKAMPEIAIPLVDNVTIKGSLSADYIVSEEDRARYGSGVLGNFMKSTRHLEQKVFWTEDYMIGLTPNEPINCAMVLEIEVTPTMIKVINKDLKNLENLIDDIYTNHPTGFATKPIILERTIKMPYGYSFRNINPDFGDFFSGAMIIKKIVTIYLIQKSRQHLGYIEDDRGADDHDDYAAFWNRAVTVTDKKGEGLEYEVEISFPALHNPNDIPACRAAIIAEIAAYDF